MNVPHALRRTPAAAAVAVAVAALVVALLAWAARPAGANGGQAMAVDITSSVQTVDEESGDCTWTVVSDITVVNLTSSTLTYLEIGPQVAWTGPGGASGVVTASSITVLDDGGLEVGDTLAPFAQETYSPYVVEFMIPCVAADGDLSVRITTAGGTGSGDAPFLEDGAPMPPMLVGMLAGAGVLGVAGATAVARRRRSGTGTASAA